MCVWIMELFEKDPHIRGTKKRNYLKRVLHLWQPNSQLSNYHFQFVDV